MKFHKRRYGNPVVRELTLESGISLLAASIIDDTQIIESVGQELGPTYDLSKEIDENTGKTFSHEWETNF